MNFTAKDVQALREQTGCGMMDCKKALTECDGDMDKATDYLREKGLAAAVKKSTRIAAEGVIDCYIENGKGVIIEVNAETDFVAKNEKFQTFVRNCAVTAVKNQAKSVEELKTLPIEGDKGTVEEALKDKIFTIGENMNIRRFELVEGKVYSYIHGGGKIGVMTVLDTDLAESDELAAIGKGISMQIAAMNPQYLCPDCIPADVVEKEKAIIIAQIKNDPKNASKPDAIIEKMVGGKLVKYYEGVCLTHQAYFLDPDGASVSKFLENESKKLGGKIAIKSYVRFERGEGLEKRNDNFAEEIAKMTAGK
ncbi:MAG: elongation factor Ts [Clostridia bacterium]|nr:elongation factor Ts [Clostridia bacterium]